MSFYPLFYKKPITFTPVYYTRFSVNGVGLSKREASLRFLWRSPKIHGAIQNKDECFGT